MITQSWNINPKHIFIAWHNHPCILVLSTYQKLISPFLRKKLIYETYDNVNHMHLVHFHHSYMNEIMIFFHCYQDPLIIVYLHPNVYFVFLYRFFCWIFLRIISLNIYIYLFIIIETIISSLPTFHWTNNPGMKNMKWYFFYCGNVKKIMKDIYTFLVKSKTFIYNCHSYFVFASFCIT